MLLMSAVLSALGLYAMSHASGGMLFAAATVFALGVCFFWPTMLGYVSENFPKTGALGLAIMGGAGMLTVSFVLPVMGRFYDSGIAARIPAGRTAVELAATPVGGELGSLWIKIQADAGLETIGRVALLPAVLSVVFLVLLLLRRHRRTPAGAAPV
jgi:MFS family permease